MNPISTSHFSLPTSHVPGSVRLIARSAKSLTAEFGRGFDASNLRYMRLFYLAFPIRDALRHELSWTQYWCFQKTRKGFADVL